MVNPCTLFIARERSEVHTNVHDLRVLIDLDL